MVLTGDIHSNWVADLQLDFDDERSALVGTEFVGTSITSGGDGVDMSSYGEALLANNPHVKFYNAQRGYMLARVDAEQWQTDFKIVDKVTENYDTASLNGTTLKISYCPLDRAIALLREQYVIGAVEVKIVRS